MRIRFPSSSTPAFNHFWMSRTTRRSTMRCSMNFTSHSCEIASKKPRMAGNTLADKEATWKTLVLDTQTEKILQTLCTLLRNVAAWKVRGVSVPTGILLSSPPGIGKTQIARTLANESELSFVAASTADLKANFLGQSANRVKNLFERVRASAPAICF